MREFEWDEKKRLENIAAPGLDFLDAELFFDAPYVTKSTRSGNDRERWLATGTMNGAYVTTVFTPRGEVARIISMRSAQREERRRYREVLGG